MIAYKFRKDMVYDGPVEFPDGPTIPQYHTFESPGEIPDGYYAVMAGGWVLIEGVAPVYPPVPSPAEQQEALRKEVVAATQYRLDQFAATRNYDSILSASTYSASTVESFRAEGLYAVSARDATWAKLYQIMADVQSGSRLLPASYYEIEGELPVLEWPI